MISKLFPDASLYEFEAYNSCIKQNWKYPSNCLLDKDKNFIANNCNLMFVLSGSIFSKYTADLLNEISEIDCKKVLLGAGAYQYDNFDKQLCKKLAPKYDYIFTRDDVTYSYFNEGTNNVFSGIDLALFAEEYFRAFQNNSGEQYAVVNLDLLQHNISENMKVKKELDKKYGKCYVVENTTARNNNIPDYLYCGYADTLFKVFYNASYTVTNRLHSSVACILGSTPFKYEGDDQGGDRKEYFI